MTTNQSAESVMEILRAWLKRENLVLCKSTDTTFALDGEQETTALREIAVLSQDVLSTRPAATRTTRRYRDDKPTVEIPSETIAHMCELSRRSA